MDESDAIGYLIGEIDKSLAELEGKTPTDSPQCEAHRRATIVLLKCQRANLNAARTAAADTRKTAGIVATAVAILAAAIQYALNR